MCGIVGIASIKPIISRDWLELGCINLAHRGPDYGCVYWSKDNTVGLGHRRLSILDLSSAANQPMHHDSRGLTIVFNGEVYNFAMLKSELQAKGEIFTTNSDTEVVLSGYHHWGIDVIKRLDGMFAMAIYDSKKQCIFLARDRAGEKPLFYHLSDGEIRFSSELKALLADKELPRRLDPRGLDCYLTMGYIPGKLCILENFNKLEAAHALCFHLKTGAVDCWRYWNLPDPPSIEIGPNLSILTDELEELIESAVKRQLVADVPVGVLLSGGIDSSMIAAFAAKIQPGIKTFTVGFENYKKYDETKHALLVANALDTEHRVLQANKVDVSLLEKLAYQYDEPIIDSSMIPTTLLSEQIARYCKVALGGDGGDELFGGYYSASRMAWLQEKGTRLPKILRQTAGFLADRVMAPSSKGRNFLSHLGSIDKSQLPLFGVKFDLETRRQLICQLPGWQPYAEKYWDSRVPGIDNYVERITRFDFNNYLVEDILVKVDRASMMHSLEIRTPFLDRAVVEFAYGRVPWFYKASLTGRKVILRELSKRILPSNFDFTRKQGFSIPLKQWLQKGDWRTYFEAVLFDSQMPFCRDVISGLFKDIDRGKEAAELLFGLVMLELWCRHYQVKY